MHRHAVGWLRLDGVVRRYDARAPRAPVSPSRIVCVKAPESAVATRPVGVEKVRPALTLSSVRRRTFRAFHARAFWPTFAGAFVLTLCTTTICLVLLHGQERVSYFFWMLPLVAAPLVGLGLLYQRGWFKAFVTIAENELLVRTPLAPPVRLRLPALRTRLFVAESDGEAGAQRVVLAFESGHVSVQVGFQTPHDEEVASLRRLLSPRHAPRLRIPIEMAPSDLIELAKRLIPSH